MDKIRNNVCLSKKSVKKVRQRTVLIFKVSKSIKNKDFN